VGPGEGGGFGGGVFRVGGGVTAPTLLAKVEPEYSEEARKAKHAGTVVLYIEVTVDGKADNIRVQHSLGLGLDEKAIEAVKKWRFSPGKKDGKPVRVAATIEVNFRLL
jgi:TonB family protein